MVNTLPDNSLIEPFNSNMVNILFKVIISISVLYAIASECKGYCSKSLIILISVSL